ncbi:hypothetical protein [Micromonospora sp. NPDC049900]|uniref:hypothetical protein n=1 Tax=unclassified Micromonospora TaxID=2617518 RepID=UPI003788D840
MIRFHGHSTAWDGGDKEERFRYAYGDEELRRWSELLTDLAGQVDERTCCSTPAAPARPSAALLGVKAARSVPS